jgi:hypothetical protein
MEVLQNERFLVEDPNLQISTMDDVEVPPF